MWHFKYQSHVYLGPVLPVQSYLSRTQTELEVQSMQDSEAVSLPDTDAFLLKIHLLILDKSLVRGFMGILQLSFER